MSWNAAKRVLTMGYRNVAWYPDGTDGWEAVRTPRCETQPGSGRAANSATSLQSSGLPNRAAERKHALLDGGGHFADISDRFAPIVENARAPFDLRGERVDLGLVRVRLVLQFAQCGTSDLIFSASSFSLRATRSIPLITSLRCWLKVSNTPAKSLLGLVLPSRRHCR